MVSKEDEVDVFIVGAGPAGLMLAASLSRMGNVKFAVIDKRAAPPAMGNADGVQVRSVEIFDAFGFADQVLKKAYHVVETSFWHTTRDGVLCRRSRNRDTPQGASTFPHVILAQNEIMKHLSDIMQESAQGKMLYSHELVDVALPKANQYSSHPVHATVMDSTRKEARIVRSKYLVSMEGSRSFIRKHFDIRFEGEHTTAVWGVMDVHVRTTFPDIRVKTVIQTPSHGNLLIIPREGGLLVRFYIEMMALEPGQRMETGSVSLAQLIERAKNIFHPYDLEVVDVQWWSLYQVGQKVAERFAVQDDEGQERIFLGGDASHSHSPKAGQGMNVSMQDAFNLGWKLSHVISGKGQRSLLPTYSVERKNVAETLISFDHKFAKAFIDGNAKEGQSFESLFKEQELFTAGLATSYSTSSLTLRGGSHFLLGKRFPPAQVVRHCDAKVKEVLSLLKADGRWRLIVFTGDITKPAQFKQLENVCAWLQRDLGPLSDLLEAFFILANPRDDMELNQLPALCTPQAGPLNLRMYDKVFCDTESYHQGHGHAYDALGIDKSGRLILVRPDQYISAVVGLSNLAYLSEFLSSFYHL